MHLSKRCLDAANPWTVSLEDFARITDSCNLPAEKLRNAYSTLFPKPFLSKACHFCLVCNGFLT